MRIFKFTLIALFSLACISFLDAQCYEIGFDVDGDGISDPVSFNPDPMDLVEAGGTTVTTVTFCNEEDVVPNDPNGNTQITLCGAKLFPISEPSGTYASNLTWFQFDACWIGVIPAGSVTPAGCGTIDITWEATANTTEDLPENCVNVNTQPAGIIAGNACFDAADDATDGCTYTATPVGVPVELISFTASKNGTQADLAWRTATEVNNSHFEIERSTNGRDFSYIGEVEGAGTTSVIQSYDFADRNPANGQNYYRFKQVDRDGTFEYSPVRSLDFSVAARTVIYPNPVVDFAVVETNISDASLEVYNVAGNKVLKSKILTGKNIDTSVLTSGVYIFKVVDTEGNTVSADRVIVSK